MSALCAVLIPLLTVPRFCMIRCQVGINQSIRTTERHSEGEPELEGRDEYRYPSGLLMSGNILESLALRARLSPLLTCKTSKQSSGQLRGLLFIALVRELRSPPGEVDHRLRGLPVESVHLGADTLIKIAVPDLESLPKLLHDHLPISPLG